MDLFRDVNGRLVSPGDVLLWDVPGVGTAEAEVVEYGPWQGERVAWVRLPAGNEAPLFARDVAMLRSREGVRL